jgi:hypothetical protein
MKQIWPNYSYSPATNVLTLTGLNIDRDQLLLVTAADRGRIMYNFADSSVTASAFTSGANTALTLVATTAGLTTTAALVIYYDDQLASTTVTVSSLPAISGTVTANISGINLYDQGILDGGDNLKVGLYSINGNDAPAWLADGGGNVPISGTVSLGIQQSDDSDVNIKFLPIGFAQSDGGGMLDYWVGVKQTNPLPVYLPSTYSLPTGTNRIGVVTIGGGTVTIGAGTAQIGSVTASISGTVPVSGTFWQTTQPTSLASLPALAAGTAQIGSVTASISNSAVTVYPAQGTSVTNSNFTSLTSSTSLVSAVAGREVLTVFNEGAGNLHISPGATCTTVAYQVRLSAGDYWECPAGQLSLAHTAVFATAGTARITEVN